jgi:hypothetical protein
MPTKHIPDHIWQIIEDEIVNAVTETQHPVKESDIFCALIIKGAENMTGDDYRKLVQERYQKP